jgi:OFA family oxalate/formate antiporter-like MFS transporter
VSTGPLGGVRLLAGGALVNLSLGSLFSWSLFVAPLAEAFDRSTAAVSSVFSVTVAVFATVVLAGGRVVDRWPARRIVLVAAATGAAGMVVAARADTLLWVVGGYGVLFGIANGLGYATAVAVAGKGFGDRRGFALGVVVGAYAAGPLVASPTITTALSRTDWRMAFLLLGVAISIALGFGAVLLGQGVDDPAADPPAVGRGTRRPLLLRPRGVVLWLAFLAGTLPAMLVIAHAAAIAGARGLGAAAVSAAVALLGAGNLTGRAGGGWLSDRIGRLPGLRIATAGLAAACLVMSMVAATAHVLVLMVLVGIGYGTQSSLVPALTADLFGTADFGANYGRVFTGWGVAGLVGPQLGARLSDGGDFRAALWMGTASAVVAFVLHTLLRRMSVPYTGR